MSDEYEIRETTTVDGMGHIVPVVAMLRRPAPAAPPAPILMPESTGCERGCPLGECYHGEPFLSDFDDDFGDGWDEG